MKCLMYVALIYWGVRSYGLIKLLIKLEALVDLDEHEAYSFILGTPADPRPKTRKIL